MSQENIQYNFIPLSSNEPLWEWDIVSDALYLSRGACKGLKLANAPATMKEFYSFLSPSVAEELALVREGVISGKSGSTLECNYLCNGLWAHEYLFVLNRNSVGRATRMMGRITTGPMPDGQSEFRVNNGILASAGLWLYCACDERLWRDKTFAAIVGDAESTTLSRSEWMDRIHPDERPSLIRHYQLVCENPLLGDDISDMVRVRHADGTYIPVVLRASVIGRDKNGKAEMLAGFIIRENAPEEATRNIMKDDRLFHALNSMGGGQWNWDTRNDLMFFCTRYLDILGYTPADREKFTKNWRDHIHPDDLGKVSKAQLAILPGQENGDGYECTYRMRRADDSWVWIFDRGCVTWRDSEGVAGHMLGSITNITTAQADREKLEELVRHDSLTGLRSREYYNLEVEHIEHNKIRPVSVISIDITGLKMINDTVGHAGGDELLTKAATLLRNSLRATDCIARVGGDEFMLLLPNCGSAKGNKLLEKIIKSFKDYNADNPSIPVYAAFGLATSEDKAEQMDSIVARADRAMYENKAQERSVAHAAIKSWIKQHTGKDVGPDERLA